MAMSRVAKMALMSNGTRNRERDYRNDGGREYRRDDYRNDGGREYQRGMYDEMGGDYNERSMRNRERYDGRDGGMRNRERDYPMRRGRMDDEWDDDDYAGSYAGKRGRQRTRRSGVLAWDNQPMDDEEMPEHLDQAKAQAWVQKMKQADGRMGEKWKMEQTEQVRAQWCPECNKYDFYAAINMMAADYGKTAQKFGVDKPEFYACLAKDFLNDPDAKSAKIVKYMRAIPE